MMADDTNLHLLLGEIKGKLDMVINKQDLHTRKVDNFSDRLNKVESKAALNGMFTGGIASLGIAFIRHKTGL